MAEWVFTTLRVFGVKKIFLLLIHVIPFFLHYWSKARNDSNMSLIFWDNKVIAMADYIYRK